MISTEPARGIPPAERTVPNGTYELFDHTADLGVRVTAPTPAELVWPATQGLYATIGELTPVGEETLLTLKFTGPDPAYLLRDYLAELLHFFEHDRRIATAADVQTFTDHELAVTARLRAVDEQHSEYAREVKAVTYHELEIRPVAGGVELKYIVDI